MYQEARARIFKDFVESPPETPPPGKQEKSRRQDKNDDFSGRSQFFPVMQPMPGYYAPQQGYHDALMQTAMQQPMIPNMQQMQQAHTPPRFNPTANFTPANYSSPMQQQQQQFSPSAPQFATIPPNRSYPNFTTIRERGGYPPQQQAPPQQQVYPQQQQNGYYPSPQSPPTMHGTRSYPQPPMMQASYSSGGGYPQQQQHPQHPQHQHQHPQHPQHKQQGQFGNPPATTPPPINRQLQGQFPTHNQQQSFTQRQPQPQHLGWGGVAMAPRSSSAPGHHHMPESHAHAAIGSGMNGYNGGAVGTGAWSNGSGGAWNNGNTVGRGGGGNTGIGGGMNMRM